MNEKRLSKLLEKYDESNSYAVSNMGTANRDRWGYFQNIQHVISHIADRQSFNLLSNNLDQLTNKKNIIPILDLVGVFEPESLGIICVTLFTELKREASQITLFQYVVLRLFHTYLTTENDLTKEYIQMRLDKYTRLYPSLGINFLEPRLWLSFVDINEPNYEGFDGTKLQEFVNTASKLEKIDVTSFTFLINVMSETLKNLHGLWIGIQAAPIKPPKVL